MKARERKKLCPGDVTLPRQGKEEVMSWGCHPSASCAAHYDTYGPNVMSKRATVQDCGAFALLPS